MMTDAIENEPGSPSAMEAYLYDDVGPSPALTPDAADDEDSDSGPRDKREGHLFASIEDFYARYPELGRGDWKLRIIRTEPKSHRGQAISGFVCDIFEKISQSEFSAQFGGGVYRVLLMRPTTDNEGTLADFKTVREIKIRVAGEPMLRNDMPPPQYDASNKGTNQVEVTRLQLEDRERTRLHQDKNRAEEKAERLQRDLMPNFYETTRKVVTDLSGMKDAEVGFWKDEVTRLREESKSNIQALQHKLSENEQALKKSQEEMVRLKHEATTNTLQIESRVLADQKIYYNRVVDDQRTNLETRITDLKDAANTAQRELRDRLTDETRRLVDDYTRKLHDQAESHKGQIADIVQRNDSDRKSLFEANMLERERLRTDGHDRVLQLTTQRATEMVSLRETYEARIADLRSATDRELAALRDATAREVESVRQSERAQTALARETSEIRKDSVKADEARLRQELSDLRRESADLRDRLEAERASKHKDLPTAIREAREMASHLGLVEAGDVERPEAEQSTVSQFVGLARQAFDSAPQILEKLMQARKEQQDAVLQAQAMQTQAAQVQAQQAMAMQARQVRQLPAPQGFVPNEQQQQQQQQRQQQQQWQQQQQQQQRQQQQQQQPRYAPPGMPTPGEPVYPVPFAPPPSVAASPVQARQKVMPDVSLQPEPDQQVGLSLPAVEEQGLHADALSEEDSGMIVMFFQKLEVAIENKVISPETFAIGVIDEIGLETTANLLRKFSPREIVETASQISPNSRVATREGQKFVTELWRVAGQRVSATGL